MTNEQPFSEETVWSFLEEQYKHQHCVVAKVIEATSQHLIVDVRGIKGYVHPWPFTFMWAIIEDVDPNKDRRNQLQAATIQRIKDHDLQLIITEIDRQQHHLVFSLPKVTKEEAQQRDIISQKMLQDAQKGDIRRGTITSLKGNGASLDLDGLQGWMYYRTMSRSAFHLQQEVEVVIHGKTDHVVLCLLKNTIS